VEQTSRQNRQISVLLLRQKCQVIVLDFWHEKELEKIGKKC
jgi:hypothetical protein